MLWLLSEGQALWQAHNIPYDDRASKYIMLKFRLCPIPAQTKLYVKLWSECDGYQNVGHYKRTIDHKQMHVLNTLYPPQNSIITVLTLERV